MTGLLPPGPLPNSPDSNFLLASASALALISLAILESLSSVVSGLASEVELESCVRVSEVVEVLGVEDWEEVEVEEVATADAASARALATMSEASLSFACLNSSTVE